MTLKETILRELETADELLLLADAIAIYRESAIGPITQAILYPVSALA